MTKLRLVGAVLVGMLAAWLILPSDVQAQLRPGRFARLLVGNGTQAVPSIAFVSQSNSGFSFAAGVLQYNKSGAIKWSATSAGIDLISGYTLGWNSDTTMTRAAAAEITYTTLAFAALGTPANGTQAFCTDCAPTTPASCPATKASCVCTSGGVGSLAIRVNALWYCPF